MSTRGAVIIFDKKQEIFKGNYNHFDSYPEGLGRKIAILNNEKEIEEFIKNNLDFEFNDKEFDYIIEANNLEDFSLRWDEQNGGLIDYIYIFYNNQWYFCEFRCENNLKLLKDYFEQNNIRISKVSNEKVLKRINSLNIFQLIFVETESSEKAKEFLNNILPSYIEFDFEKFDFDKFLDVLKRNYNENICVLNWEEKLKYTDFIIRFNQARDKIANFKVRLYIIVSKGFFQSEYSKLLRDFISYKNFVLEVK